MMHASRLETSKPLQAILMMLRDRGQQGATTKEIADGCGVENAATWISALRKNGFRVESDYQGMNENGRKIWRYHLIEMGELF
jgi:hypothetical protein